MVIIPFSSGEGIFAIKSGSRTDGVVGPALGMISLWGGSDVALDVPDEGAEAELGGGFVHLTEFLEDGIHALVLYHGDDGGGQRWPGVGATR